VLVTLIEAYEQKHYDLGPVALPPGICSAVLVSCRNSTLHVSCINSGTLTTGGDDAPDGADATLELQQEQRAELEKVARSRRTPQAVAQRARIVLMTAEGVSPSTIGEELGVLQPTVRKWRARYAEDGLAGLRNEPRQGRPRTLDDQRVADLVNKALQTRPAKQTHWSVRSFAA
jgi:Winged helix-turn helix